ncbi:alpha/beta fold hydrolase [Streptomyces sp. NPDC018964]|uniref:alpha/beta fold hydrolase n=1 Tax=Streptomyces sp. NPDC018964 TaxID=3365058 RepID=UPI0037BA57A3
MLILPPVRVGEHSLPDGRVIGWAEWGRPNGTPVLLSPGAATSRHLGIDATAVAETGIRLISLDRPGLGVSSPSPQRTLADFAADVVTLSQQMGLGKPAMIGFSQGAPFALACAAADAVSALAVVSAADEIAAPRFAGTLPPDLQQLVDLSVDKPEQAAQVFATLTSEAMWDMVISGSPDCDRHVYESEPFASTYRTALREAFTQGPEGYARDTVLAMSRWGIDLASIGIPVDVWYGELDLSHSPDQGASLAARIPTAVRHLVPDSGGSVLWTESLRVLRTLIGRVSGPN